MEHRVTLSFSSDSGREYLYDDITGAILPWDATREAVLRAVIAGDFDRERPRLEGAYGAEAVAQAAGIILHMRHQYGAFVRHRDPHQGYPEPDAAGLEALIRRSASFQLILVLTQDCNMRCRYCAYSEVYPLNRKRTVEMMSFDTARRAVDMFVTMVEPQRRRNPRKRFGLTFYGGEPMMNMPVLKRVLEYAAETYPGMFIPVMTTNGTLLTPRNVEVLVRHQVFTAVSLDGPAEEHDRLRIFPRERGTHERIMANLRRIRRDWPDYWRQYMTTVSVYDYGTDVEAADRFFAEHADVVPRAVFVNKVGDRNTTYYQRYTAEDRQRFTERIRNLSRAYKDALVAGEPVSSYARSLVGFPISMCLLRQRLNDQKVPFLPFSGTCIPGNKVCVHVDGRLDMCERVNGTYPIGHLDQGGIDFERVRDLIVRYQRQVLTACHSCPATRHCGICFSHVEGNGDFARIPSLCAETVANARRRLADYVSIRERNPHADFAFETDTSYLEQRLLMFF